MCSFNNDKKIYFSNTFQISTRIGAHTHNSRTFPIQKEEKKNILRSNTRTKRF